MNEPPHFLSCACSNPSRSKLIYIYIRLAVESETRVAYHLKTLIAIKSTEHDWCHKIDLGSCQSRRNSYGEGGMGWVGKAINTDAMYKAIHTQHTHKRR